MIILFWLFGKFAGDHLGIAIILATLIVMGAILLLWLLGKAIVIFWTALGGKWLAKHLLLHKAVHTVWQKTKNVTSWIREKWKRRNGDVPPKIQL